MLELLAKVIAAYLLGGVMGGDVMRRLVGGADLRTSGSGNVGAANALRSRGKGFALGVLSIDIGKGVLAALLIPRLPWPWTRADMPQPELLGYACGLGVALGHCYPLFAHFKGGKGVATLTGVFGALLPAALPWMFAVFALVLMLTGYVSLSSLAGAVAALFWVACVSAFGAWSLAGGFGVAMLLLVLFKHRANLWRVFAGTESRFGRARVLGNWIDRWRVR